MLKTLQSLDTVKRIKLYDYSDYDSNNCCTGGSYGDWDTYTRVPEGWRLSYHTTADFQYCPICGDFGDHLETDENGNAICSWTGHTYDVLSDEQMLDTLSRFVEDDKHWVDIEYLED
jgi:hypothetical protein